MHTRTRIFTKSQSSWLAKNHRVRVRRFVEVLIGTVYEAHSRLYLVHTGIMVD